MWLCFVPRDSGVRCPLLSLISQRTVGCKPEVVCITRPIGLGVFFGLRRCPIIKVSITLLPLGYNQTLVILFVPVSTGSLCHLHGSREFEVHEARLPIVLVLTFDES